MYDYFVKIKEQDDASVKIKAQLEREEILSLVNNNPINNEDVFGFEYVKEYSDSFLETIERVNYFKTQIETNGLYRQLYCLDKPIADESMLQNLFKLVWHKTKKKYSPESNSGVGPVDFVLSMGIDNSCLIEFKLGKNKNIDDVYRQVDEYKKSHRVEKAIIVIFYFNKKEMDKAVKVFNNNPNQELNKVI